MAGNGYDPLVEASGTISPLPPVLRQGLIAIATLSCLSFVSAMAVLLYLTVKFARWHLRNWRQRNTTDGPLTPPVDLSLGLAERHYMGENAKHQTSLTRKRARPNQFLVLIYNLLLADLHQAASFLLNAVWVGRDGIQVGTATCWAQAWLIQTGDLASSLFITAIAVHTYLAVVWNYTPPQSAIYIAVVSLWAFNFILIIIGIAITDNGREVGGFFVRATAWCWINIRYEALRLYLHYLWIFLALVVTSILYTLIFLSLHNKRGSQQASHNLGPAAATDSTTNIHDIDNDANSTTKTPSPTTLHPHPGTNPNPIPPGFVGAEGEEPGEATYTEAHNNTITNAITNTTNTNDHHHRAFLLYPLIYIICTAPLALGRVATMAGVDVPISYFCTAGALITSNGWLDVLLWGVTRHRLLFSGDVGAEDSGLDTFAFMRTPHGRRWGNMVWVEGGQVNNTGGGNGNGNGVEGTGEAGKLGGLVKRRMGWRPLGFGGGNGGGGGGQVEGQQAGEVEGREDGLAIQMDMVTTVVVEPAAEVEAKGWGRRRSSSRHAPSRSAASRSRVAYDTDSAAEDGLVKNPG